MLVSDKQSLVNATALHSVLFASALSAEPDEIIEQRRYQGAVARVLGG